MGGVEDHGRAPPAKRRRRAVPQLGAQRRGRAQGREDAAGMAGFGDRLSQDQQARPSRDRSGRRVPRHRRRRADCDAVGGGPGDRAEKSARTIPPHSGAQRKVVSGVTATETAPARSGAATRETGGWRPPSYWPVVLPALIVGFAGTIFPWAYTSRMSLHG